MNLDCKIKYIRIIRKLKSINRNPYSAYELFKKALSMRPMESADYDEAVKLAAEMLKI